MNRAVIRIPAPLRSLTQGHDELSVECQTVGAALTALGERYRGVSDRILTAEGELRPFVRVFLGARDVQGLQGLATQVPEGSVISIVPAVAGGRSRGGLA